MILNGVYIFERIALMPVREIKQEAVDLKSMSS